jgi:hypothetical protein
MTMICADCNQLKHPGTECQMPEDNMVDHYRVSWRKGRRIGAQGIFYPDSVVVQAASEEEAIRKAYETHEHLFFAEAEKINQP